MPAMCCSRRVSMATSTVNSKSRQSTCGSARALVRQPRHPDRIGHRTGVPRHVRLVVALLRRERVQRVTAVTFEVAALRRVDDEAEQPSVGDDRGDRMDAGPAVGADRGQIAEARPVLLEENADPVGESGLVGGEFGPGSHVGILSNKCTSSDLDALVTGTESGHFRQRGYGGPMLLSDRDLVSEIKAGTLGLEPFEPTLVQPSSIDVRLDRLFRVFNNHLYTHIDPADAAGRPDLGGRGRPTASRSCCTRASSCSPRRWRSSRWATSSPAGWRARARLGRLGLLTHSTAGFIDPGFSGHVTLELSNVANLPITLWPGMKIGQLCIFRLSSPAEHPYGSAVYGSRYQGQRGPTPSRAWQHWRTWPTR